MLRSSASGTEIVKCTVPEQQTPTACPRMCWLWVPVYSREHEELKTFRETWEGMQVPGAAKEWTQSSGGRGADATADGELTLGFPTNCMENSLHWVFSTVLHSKVHSPAPRPHPASAHCSRGRSLPNSKAEHRACSCPPRRKGCHARIHNEEIFFSTWVRYISSKKGRCSPSLFSYQVGFLLSM